MLAKIADLLANVKLQPQQQRLEEEAEQPEPIRKLLYHTLGSGKTLSSLAMAEAKHDPRIQVLVPASLRPNFLKEVNKYTTRPDKYHISSYTALGQGKVAPADTLIMDEAHAIKNYHSQRAQQALRLAAQAKNVILLSGSPTINSPADLATPLSILTNKPITPAEFTERYVGDQEVKPNIIKRFFGAKPYSEPVILHRDELKSILRGHVDYYAPPHPNVTSTTSDVITELGPKQTNLYKAMFHKLPWLLRWKLKWDFPLSQQELANARRFLTGPRQVALSTYPYYAKYKDNPYLAFQESPKLQTAFTNLQKHLEQPHKKVLVFSNFVQAGLVPYAAALDKAKIPYAMFHGGLSDKQRKQLVDDFNNDKIRVALLGPSGTEGISTKGTTNVQLLDSSWQEARGRQSIGRAMRFDSHEHLPPELRHVDIERYVARLPLGVIDSLLHRIGFDKTKEQLASDDYLRQLSERKEKRNQLFLRLLQEVGGAAKSE